MNLQHDVNEKKRVQAAHEAHRLALEITAGLLAAQLAVGLHVLRQEHGVTFATNDEALVSPAGQAAVRLNERLIALSERAQSIGINVNEAIVNGVLESDVPDREFLAEFILKLVHFEGQFGIA